MVNGEEWELKLETILTKEYVERYQSQWPNRTILDYLDDAIEKHPDKIAIIDRKSRYTYRELGKLVNRVALGLNEIGLGKGDVISLQLPNWTEFVILHLAITKIGAITNPLIPFYRDREIGYMVGLAESKMIVVPSRFRNFYYPEMIHRLMEQWPAMEHVYVIGDDVPNGMKSFSSLIDVPWEEKKDINLLNEITLDPNDITQIIFTSGTTGNPKGVMHTHNSLCIAAQYWNGRLGLNADDVMFMASTVAHQTGFVYGVRAPVQAGGTAIFQDMWNPREFVDFIEKDKVTITAGATPFLRDFIGQEGLENFDLRTLKIFGAYGAPIPRALVKEARERFNFNILAGWGQTENGLVTLTNLEDPEEKLIGSDGIPFTGMEVKIVDEEGNECPRNQEGNLLSKGPAHFVGYLKRMEDTLKEFSGDWFMTGDRATMDEDGYIRITGRSKDIIIRGGENIPVAYIENILYEHPDISDAQVVAMPDPRLQEKACAFISMKAGKTPLTLKTLQTFLTDKGVAKQYWPEHVEVIDDFPRTPSGKIQKFRLREKIKELVKE